jgi:thioredoxin reductase (NADPH)
METLSSFLVAVLVTLFFVGRYLKRISAENRRAAEDVPAAAEAGGGPRPVINASVCIGCGSCVSVCPETGALAVVRGKAILANPGRCASHGLCAAACPTQAITLSFAGLLQTMRVPSISAGFESNVPGVYIIGELGGIGLIKNGINEGRQVIEQLRQRLVPNGTGQETWDVIIAGTGPAGLSAALSAHECGLRYLAFEQGEIASTIRHYPRHKLVFAEPLEMPLYGRLRIEDTSKESLLCAWEKMIAETGVRIQTNTRVDAVRRAGDVLLVETARGGYRAKAVILAIGKRGSPRLLGVPGEELGKVAYRLIEADTYKDEDVLVVGGGDSAIECALALARGGRNRVALSYRGDAFTRLKQRNLALLESAESEGRIRVLRNSRVVEIRPDSVALEQNGGRVELPNSYVFILAGGESPEAFLAKIGIEMVERSVGLTL